MTGIILTLIIILIVALVFLPFLSNLMKDSKDLETPLEERFRLLISRVNQAFMGGMGTVNHGESRRLVYLFNDNMANMVIQFYYSTGHLTVILKYKYFQQELIFKKVFYNMRNPSIFDQEDSSNAFIEEGKAKMKAHQTKVFGNPNAGVGHMNIGISTPEDPLGIVRQEFSHLSIDQRKAFIGFMYSVGCAGLPSQEVRQQPALLQEVKIIGVGLDESISQLSSKGDEYMFSQLKNIGDGALHQLLLASAGMVRNEACTDRLFHSFERLGYSRKYIDEELNKMMTLSQLFMGR